MRTSAWFLLLFPLALSAAVDGVVINRTTDQPQPGVTITLTKLGQGMEVAGTTKTGPDGKFRLEGDAQGMHLLQANHQGVTYNKTMQPGQPLTNLQLEVYDVSAKPVDAQIEQHMILVEPGPEGLVVNETLIYRNSGKTTFNNPDTGTLQFYLPPEAKDEVKVMVVAPNGLPVTRPAEKAKQPNVHYVSYPIKPGETRFDLTYQLPKPVLSSRVLHEGGRTLIVAPKGVELKGEGLQSKGVEPRTQASIFELKSGPYKVEVSGTGSLREQASTGGEEGNTGGPQITPILPRVYDRIEWVLGLTLGILALGFFALYRQKGHRGA